MTFIGGKIDLIVILRHFDTIKKIRNKKIQINNFDFAKC